MKKQYGNYSVTFSNIDKPLIGTITKGAIIEYYEHISSTMVPYTKDHPVMMHRFPNGIAGESFYQKDVSDYFPSWIKRVKIDKKGDGHYHALLAQNTATLVYLANQGCITPHLWLSRYDKLERPDRIIFDLDPAGKDFTVVREVALAIKQLLDSLDIVSFVMTSGSKGLHIYVPLRRSATFETTKTFARRCAELIVEQYPKKATLELRKDKRDNKVFIDYLRNQLGATAVSPYAIRAILTAPIATPLDWTEVQDPSLSPQKYTINNFFTHFTKNPWEPYFSSLQTLTKALKKLGLT